MEVEFKILEPLLNRFKIFFQFVIRQVARRIEFRHRYLRGSEAQRTCAEASLLYVRHRQRGPSLQSETKLAHFSHFSLGRASVYINLALAR
jgi:hypothetical protein